MKQIFFGDTSNTYIQFFRYLWVGGSSALIDLCVFSICVYWFKIPLFLSAFIAYMFGLAWNYIISIFWIFESKKKSKEIIAVFLIALGGLLWTWWLLYIFVDVYMMSEIIAKAISQILILAWNFGMRKWVVF